MTKTATRPRVSRPVAPPPADRGPALTALLAVLLVFTAIGAVYFYTQDSSKADRIAKASLGEEARRAACYYVPDMVNFDYRNLDPFFSKMSAGATGDWKKQFDDTAPKMREVVTGSKMSSQAGDTECGLVSVDGSTATVVVAVAQTLTTGTDPNPRPAQVAMVAQMEKHGDDWLCARLNAPMFS